MSAVLGIDAAWTEKGSSGVALAIQDARLPRCVHISSSYAEFCSAAGITFDRHAPGASLLTAAMELAGGPIDVVAVDMPLATIPIASRREADQEISRRYGGRKASAHSPNRDRPGAVGERLMDSLVSSGLQLATTAAPNPSPALIEVYPHVALIELMNCDERRKYKADKSLTYWPGTNIDERVRLLLAEWELIRLALEKELDVGLSWPGSFSKLNAMKPYEDRLDAAVCCWVGLKYLAGATTPLGDATAAIWVPKC